VLVEAGAHKLLFDAGRGAAQRLWQVQIPLGQLNAVFLTHLHSDHTVGLPDVWLTGWLAYPFGQRRSPLNIWGPEGTIRFVERLAEAFDADVRLRTAAGTPAAGTALAAHEVTQGVVYDRDGVRVIAFRVDHGGGVEVPAYGYRVDHGGRSVVLSGDTRPSDNLVRFAAGADVVVHEVMIAGEAMLKSSEVARRVMGSHTSPEDAGKIFARVQPKLAVYTHIGVIAAAARVPEFLDAIVPRTRSTYTGRVELGEDLMTIFIGETIEVRRSTGPTR
jgi:ribonuclease Z